MNFYTTIRRKLFHTPVIDNGFEPEIGRRLRSFDMDGTPPYDHPPVIAFLKAEKLTDLTTNEIRAFLLLRDTVDPRGLTAPGIAEALYMSSKAARSCVSGLKHKGYIVPTSIAHLDDKGQALTGWMIDPGNLWADECALFWEFAYLL